MEFLLLRILAIWQPRGSALPHETIGREPGRDGLARAYSQDDWFAIASLETETTRPGPSNGKPMMKRSKVRQWTEIEKWGRFPESPLASLIERERAQCGR